MIPYGKQSISENDILAVMDVLKSSFLTQGPMVPEFEKLLQKTFASNYCVAMNSATSALHAAYLSLGVDKGDIVWTVPNTFVATSNAALLTGADIDFIDINPVSLNIDVQILESKLKIAKVENKLPKVVTPVHFSGMPCDLREIKELSEQYGFKILEDASHAVGAQYLDTKIGDCAFSDITVFSFHPVKIFTTGEGGAALTNSRSLAKKLALYRSHGITKDPTQFEFAPPGPWYYEQAELGLNYRMSDIHAALGISQMKQIKDFLQSRALIASRYDNLLADLALETPKNFSDRRSSWHLYVVQLSDTTPSRHKEIFCKLQNDGIGVQLHYLPVHLQPYYRKLGFKQGDFPVSEKYASQAISLPIYPNLTSQEQDYVFEKLRDSI